jgi:hypothetical protein
MFTVGCARDLLERTYLQRAVAEKLWGGASHCRRGADGGSGAVLSIVIGESTPALVLRKRCRAGNRIVSSRDQGWGSTMVDTGD